MGFGKYTLSALAALLVLVEEPNARLPSRLLADRTGPPRSLLEVMRTLCVAGIVTCSRGVSGVFQLRKSASETTLLNIVEAI